MFHICIQSFHLFSSRDTAELYVLGFLPPAKKMSKIEKNEKKPISNKFMFL